MRQIPGRPRDAGVCEVLSHVRRSLSRAGGGVGAVRSARGRLDSDAWAADELLLPIVGRIAGLRRAVGKRRAVLVGISGIDASGKGFLAAQLERRLRQHGLRVANLNVDGWLNLPQVRFATSQPGPHFYPHGIRFAEMFDQLVLPLRDRCTLVLEMDYTEETVREYRWHGYECSDVDVVLVEGIFLFTREYRRHFDLACWIDCSFETAMQRALRRGQEGLPPGETIRVFETIYWPAQRLHFERDDPRSTADRIIDNDVPFSA